MESFFSKYIDRVSKTETIHYTGSVTAVKGLMIESLGPSSIIGELVKIKTVGSSEILAEVVGLENKTVRLLAYGDTKGIQVGSEVVATGEILKAPVGKNLVGRVIDATGAPYDGKGPLDVTEYYPVLASAPNPITRKPVDKRVVTGVRCIDSLLAC